MATPKKVPVVDANSTPKADLAKWVIVFSFSVIAALGIVAILTVGFGDAAKVAQIKDIISILLPVIGAWAGTVIAYYFSRENFESAAKNTQALVKEFSPEKALETVSVTESMIPIDLAVKYVLQKKADQVKIQSDLISAMDNPGGKKRNRLPVLDTNNQVLYVMHRSLLTEFLIQSASQNKTLADITLQDLLDVPEYKKTIESFGTLQKQATLAEAKALVDKIPNCSDVFITENGMADSEAVGWVTNVLILSHLRGT